MSEASPADVSTPVAPSVRTLRTTNSAVRAFEITGAVERRDVVRIAEAVNAATHDARVNLLIVTRGEACDRAARIDGWLRARIEHPQRCCRYAIVGHRRDASITSLWPRWFAPHAEAQAWDFVSAAPAADGAPGREAGTATALLVS